MGCRSATAERLQWAIDRLSQCCSTTTVVAEMARRYGCSRRTAQRTVQRAHQELVRDLDGINREHLVAQLEHALLTACAKALECDQPAVVVGVARELRVLLQLNGTVHSRNERPPWER